MYRRTSIYLYRNLTVPDYRRRLSHLISTLHHRYSTNQPITHVYALFLYLMPLLYVTTVSYYLYIVLVTYIHTNDFNKEKNTYILNISRIPEFIYLEMCTNMMK